MKLKHTIYIGYYTKNHKMICVSINKQLVINYMENHRGLTSNRYYIEKEEVDDTDILLKYDDYVISDYNGYYIPNIDQCLISIDANALPEDIMNTIDHLKNIAILSSNVKKIPEKDFESLINAIKVLNSFIKKSKVLNKLNREYCLTHSILFCDMEQYITKINNYKEMKDWDKSFNNALAEF